MREPEATVRQWIETVWNQGKLEQLEDFQLTSISNNGAPFSLEDTRGWHDRTRKTFPDLHYEIEDLIPAGDKVVVRWRATGTHLGILWGLVPPTRKQVSWQGMHVVRVDNDKIAAIWSVADFSPMLQQMGVKLLPPAAE